MSISDRLDKWITDSEEVLDAVNEGHLDPDAFTDDRAGRALAALRAVLDLHVEHQDTGKCDECTVAPYSVHSVPWPCPTVRAIAAALGEGS